MPGDDHVREATGSDVNRRLDQERLERVTALVGAPHDVITQHIEQLDRTWDVERTLEANASTLILVGLALSRWHSRRWLWLSTIVPAFLLQHAIQGWCPPIWVFRRLGIRTRREIDIERTALKALRGDFAEVGATTYDPEAAARFALEQAERSH